MTENETALETTEASFTRTLATDMAVNAAVAAATTTAILVVPMVINKVRTLKANRKAKKNQSK